MLISVAEPTTSPAESDAAVSQHTIEKYASNAWEVMVLVCVPVLCDLPTEHADPSGYGVQLPLTGHQERPCTRRTAGAHVGQHTTCCTLTVRSDGQLALSSRGFQFLLQDWPSQMWLYLKHFIVDSDAVCLTLTCV